MKKVFIFDFDYTLGDSTDGIVACVNYALENIGIEKSNREEIKKTIGLPLKELLNSLKQNGNKIAIVTTKYRHRIVDIFTKYDALGLIDLIVGDRKT